MKRLRNFSVIEAAIAVLMFLLLAAIVYALWQSGGATRREPRPHELIAGSIFFGSLLVSGALNRVADALKDRARSYNETPESKAIKELAKAVESLSRK